MTENRAREEIARARLNDEEIGQTTGHTSRYLDYAKDYLGKFRQVAEAQQDKDLQIEVNGYTIEDLIELAEKATDGKKVGVYSEDAELPENPYPRIPPCLKNVRFPKEINEVRYNAYHYAQSGMPKEGYRKIEGCQK